MRLRLRYAMVFGAAILLADCVEVPTDRCKNAGTQERQANLDVTDYHQWLSQKAITLGQGEEALVAFSSAKTQGDDPSLSEVRVLRIEADGTIGTICGLGFSHPVATPGEGLAYDVLTWATLASSPSDDGTILVAYSRQPSPETLERELYVQVLNRNGCTTENLPPLLLNTSTPDVLPAPPVVAAFANEVFVVFWAENPLRWGASAVPGMMARKISTVNAEPRLGETTASLTTIGLAVSLGAVASLDTERVLLSYLYQTDNGNTGAAVTVVNRSLNQGETVRLGAPTAARVVPDYPSIGMATHGDRALVVWKTRDEAGVERARGRMARAVGMDVEPAGERFWVSPAGVSVGSVSVVAIPGRRYLVAFDAVSNRYGPGDGSNVLMTILDEDGVVQFTRFDCHWPPQPFQVNWEAKDDDQTGPKLVVTPSGAVHGVYTDWGNRSGSDRSGSSIRAFHLRAEDLSL